MKTLRPASDRGHMNHGWLDTYHSFSFARYHDPRHMGYRSLRVINEDRVAGGGGFPTHPHDNMEILTYMVEGGLSHQDSMGSGETVRPGEIQKMSAGTGITHSEFNASETDPAHLLQIWIEPAERDLAPAYEQIRIPEEGWHTTLQLVGSPDGRDGSVTIRQDAYLYAARIPAGASRTHETSADRHLWLQVVKGALTVDDVTVSAGDGLAVTGEASITLTATEASEVLLFDLG